MKILEWNDEKMGLGIEIIDEQHKEFLKIINQLSTSIEQNSQKKDILVILDALIDYAQFHFAKEEELFCKYNYEYKEEHIDEHTVFNEKFLELRKKLENNTEYKNKSAIYISQEMYVYVTRWFIDHVTGTDRKYVSLFKENGLT